MKVGEFVQVLDLRYLVVFWIANQVHNHSFWRLVSLSRFSIFVIWLYSLITVLLHKRSSDSWGNIPNYSGTVLKFFPADLIYVYLCLSSWFARLQCLSRGRIARKSFPFSVIILPLFWLFDGAFPPNHFHKDTTVGDARQYSATTRPSSHTLSWLCPYFR